MGLWPQFRSPLVWDVFAVITYATISLLFWYVGLIPDLATLRDRAEHRLARIVYGFLAMGWRGSAFHWRRYQTAYFLIAALATPLVISVHSIVGLDFAISIIPGWHTTVAPPFFVAGAIFSGFAMVTVIAIPLRKFYRLDEFITRRHLDYMAKILLATGLIVAYGYLIETFMGWYSGSTFEEFLIRNRFLGPYAPFYWAMLLSNALVPQLLWFKRLRDSVPVLFGVAVVVLIGMWLERFIIVVVSLQRDFLPSSWDLYIPTGWDWATFLGTIGLFLALLFLFIRFLPIISIFEMRELVAEKGGEGQ
jgi:molybdopterin-containing oxidoreductase family membrane subunit